MPLNATGYTSTGAGTASANGNYSPVIGANATSQGATQYFNGTNYLAYCTTPGSPFWGISPVVNPAYNTPGLLYTVTTGTTITNIPLTGWVASGGAAPVPTFSNYSGSSTTAKYLSTSTGQITEVAASVTSVGAGSAGVIPAADATGHIDSSFLPTGIGADTQVITTTEAVAAGAYVNIYNNAGAFSLRNADSTTSGKEAHGFCLVAFASGVPATVYFNGNNTSVTGQTPGKIYLGTVGGTLTAAPTGTGKVVQLLGSAPSATTNNFTYAQGVVLA